MNTHPINAVPSPLLRPFYPALDGLRAIAFLMVFVAHYYAWIPSLRFLDWGWMGVDCFFVLSGFLITGILYDSLRSEHFFRNFYIRRALRIFPLFYGIWIFLLLATPFLHIAWNRYNAAMALYVGNFFVPGGQLYLHANPGELLCLPHHVGGAYRQIVLSHFWTLCVEEQFYLVWPAILWLVRSRRHLLNLSLAIVAVVPLLRVAYVFVSPMEASQGALYCGTIFRMDTLFVGAALALWLRGNPPSTAVIMRGATILACAAPLALAVGYEFTKQDRQLTAFNIFVNTIGFTLIAFTAASILAMAINPATALSRALQVRPLTFLGRISYGLYVIHYLPAGSVHIAALRLVPYHLQWAPPLAVFAATVGAAWLSFRYFESPFLRLKSRLAPHPVTVFQSKTAPPQSRVSPEPARGVMHPAA